MVEIILAVLAILGLSLLFSFSRTKRQAQKLQRELEARWREVCDGMERRIAALEELLSAVHAAGYAPVGENKLRKALEDLKGSARDPRALAEADEGVEAALRGIYRALPRERDERLRLAQNRLAAADEELDVLKHRYNEVVLHWHELSRGWGFRLFVRERRKPEPFALPEEEGDGRRRRLPAF
jgi:hypothetical protein